MAADTAGAPALASKTEQLRERWFAATGLHAQSPALAPLLTAYHASGDRPRYYQDAAIRAVLNSGLLSGLITDERTARALVA